MKPLKRFIILALLSLTTNLCWWLIKEREDFATTLVVYRNPSVSSEADISPFKGSLAATRIVLRYIIK